jgi:hypothetical protein
MLPRAPTLVAIDTDGSDTPDFSLPAEPIHAPVTALRLRFDAPVVATPADFRLIEAGPDGDLASILCDALPASDDIAEPLATLETIDENELTLRIASASGLRAGRYRILVCDSPGSGAPPLPERRDFDIPHSPRLDNPGFADDIARWNVRSLTPASVTAAWTARDADASSSSGALRIASPVGAPALLSSETCVLVHEAGLLAAAPTSVRLRYRVVSGTVRFVVTASAGFGAESPPFGCIGPGILRTHSFDASSGSDRFGIYETPPFDLQSLPLATLYVQLIGLQGPYEVLLDDIGFNFGSEHVFESSFEATDG